MIVSADALGILVFLSVLVVTLAPLVLLVFWLRDYKGGDLW